MTGFVRVCLCIYASWRHLKGIRYVKVYCMLKHRIMDKGWRKSPRHWWGDEPVAFRGRLISLGSGKPIESIYSHRLTERSQIMSVKFACTKHRFLKRISYALVKSKRLAISTRWYMFLIFNYEHVRNTKTNIALLTLTRLVDLLPHIDAIRLSFRKVMALLQNTRTLSSRRWRRLFRHPFAMLCM